MEWRTPVWWGWFLLFSRSGGHKTKETYPTRPGSPARFFVFHLPLFCTTTTLRCFVRLKRQTSLLHIIFLEELSYVLTQYFVSCVHVRFYFHCRLHFSFSHRRFEFSCFSSYQFSITRSSSFCVIHVSVNIKNSAEKDTTLSLFFLSKSPGSHVISFQIKP